MDLRVRGQLGLYSKFQNSQSCPKPTASKKQGKLNQTKTNQPNGTQPNPTQNTKAMYRRKGLFGAYRTRGMDLIFNIRNMAVGRHGTGTAASSVLDWIHKQEAGLILRVA